MLDVFTIWVDFHGVRLIACPHILAGKIAPDDDRGYPGFPIFYIPMKL